jgi:hypothetical protein
MVSSPVILALPIIASSLITRTQLFAPMIAPSHIMGCKRNPFLSSPPFIIAHHGFKSHQLFTSLIATSLPWPQISPVVHLPHCNIPYHGLKSHQLFISLIATSLIMASNLTISSPPSLKHILPWPQISPVVHIPHCKIPSHSLNSHQFFTPNQCIIQFCAVEKICYLGTLCVKNFVSRNFVIRNFVPAPSTVPHRAINASTAINAPLFLPPWHKISSNEISCHNSKRW